MNTTVLRTLLTYTSIALDDMRSQLMYLPIFSGLSYILSVQQTFIEDAKKKLSST